MGKTKYIMQSIGGALAVLLLAVGARVFWDRTDEAPSLSELDRPANVDNPAPVNGVKSASLTFGIHMLDQESVGQNLRWVALADSGKAPDRLVLLVHGLDEPGSIWDDLAEELAGAGYAVGRFEYPNDQDIASSTDSFANWLEQLHEAGNKEVDLVCHSMGGLVARDVLTRDTHYAGNAVATDRFPNVTRFITLGTPNQGSPWAGLRMIGEVREQILRAWEQQELSATTAARSIADGTGLAGRDLTPDSDFLIDLNARPLPKNTAITLIIGAMAPVDKNDPDWAAAITALRGVVGKENASQIESSFQEMSGQLGDGVVPAESAQLEGVQDVVYVEANHRGMIKSVEIEQAFRSLVGEKPAPPPGIAIVLDRLARPIPAP